MSYKFRTPCCDNELRIENQLSGRKLQCPHCESKFYIPQNPYQRTIYRFGLVILAAFIASLIFLFPSKANNKYQKPANQLHVIATKSQALLLESTTLKMENSDTVIHAMELFLEAEKLIEQNNYQESIPVFELAIEKLTEAQQLHSLIKGEIQPQITQLKKDIKQLGKEEKFKPLLNEIEISKNALKPKETQKLINSLRNELKKEPKQKVKAAPVKALTREPIIVKKETIQTISKPTKNLETIEIKKVKSVISEQMIESSKPEVKELKMSENESYYGGVLDNKPHGKGRFSYSNGNSYDGEWQKGEFHGTGTYGYANGDSFTGEWQMGTRNGVGTYKWKNQTSLKAMWQEGKPNGKAFFYSSDNSKTILYFKKGILQSQNKVYAYGSDDVLNSKFKLSDKQQRIHDFTQKIHFALTKLTLNDSSLKLPDLPFHQHLFARYYHGFMSERDMVKVEAEIKQDFFKIKRYVLRANKALLESDEEDDSYYGELDGYSIHTAKLGVVLDTSGSMLKYIKPLKEKINNQFPNAAFIEVTSCRLTTFTDGNISDKAADDSTMNAIKYLIDNKGVDSIYWFSDLNGTRAPEAMTQLTKWLDESLVALYVRSVGPKPDKALMELIKNSGGKYLKK